MEFGRTRVLCTASFTAGVPRWRKDSGATLISAALAGDAKLELMAGGAGSHIGRGGMLTKVLAAKRAARSGAHTVIASGHERDVLPRAMRVRCRSGTIPHDFPFIAARSK